MVHPETIRGQLVEIWVNSIGQFQATLDGGATMLSATTREGLITQLKARLREASVQVEVPFTRLSQHGEVRHGIATGIHGGNQNVLVTWDDTGKKEQWDGRDYGYSYLVRLRPQQALHLQQLQEAQRQARADYDKTLAEHRTDLRERVIEAVKREAAHAQD
jgi:hypothetical protein